MMSTRDSRRYRNPWPARATLAFLTLALVTLPAVVVRAAIVAHPGPFADVEAVAMAVRDAAWSRSVVERAVIVFQIAGVAGAMLARLAHSRPWAYTGRVAFAIAMCGLGLSGLLSAYHGSGFALFAGGTLTVLLNVAILGGAAAHPARIETA